MDFEKWLSIVIETLNDYYPKYEPNEIYSLINLTDAKLQYLDGVNPQDYAFC